MKVDMLEIRSLFVNYGDTPVLKEISLSTRPGELLSVIGPNGAGKSTLIRAVSGVLPIQSGTIHVDGRDLLRMTSKERARLLAVVPQARQLPGDVAVYETVLLGRTPYINWLGSSGANDHAAVRQALELTRLESLAQQRVGELSGGEQQRVLLARALAQDAPLLLLDEPTTHLDLQHQTVFLNLIRCLAAEKRLTVLMILHDINLASLYTDRVALLAQGKIFAAGSPAEVITSANLAAIYHIPVNVIQHPEYGTPLVLPDGRVAK